MSATQYQRDHRRTAIRRALRDHFTGTGTWVLAWCAATGLMVGLTRAVATITDPALEEAELALVNLGA